MFAESCVDACKVAMRVWILHMCGEEAPASFKDLCRTRNARSREQSRGDTALGGPSGMKKLGLGAIHPAFQQSGCEAAGDACRTRHCLCAKPQQFAGKIGRSKCGKQPRRMKASPMQLARGDAAHAAGDLVAYRDGGDEVAPGNAREF